MRVRIRMPVCGYFDTCGLMLLSPSLLCLRVCAFCPQAYVESIDIEADISLLRSALSIREQCLRNMRVACSILKLGVKHGLTLHQIASIMCRYATQRDLSRMCLLICLTYCDPHKWLIASPCSCLAFACALLLVCFVFKSNGELLCRAFGCEYTAAYVHK